MSDQTPTRASRPADDGRASRAALVAAGRRRLLVGGLVLGTVAVAAVAGVGTAVGAALEEIARRSGVETNGQVLALVEQARFWGKVSAGVMVLTAIGVLAFIAARYETEIDRLRGRMDAQEAAGRERLDEHRRAVVDGLVRLASSRDGDTGEHMQRVRGYVRALAEHMRDRHPEVDAAFVETLVETAPLHDIGKVGIPDEILLKPGPLTPEQRAEMQKHVLHGLDALIEVRRRYGDDDYLQIACEVAFAHHERYDGSGYPFGLAGETIPLSARIVALADVYDALRNERVYKEAIDHATARDTIVRHAGTHFDPGVVEAFRAVEDRFAAIFDEGAAAADGRTAAADGTATTPGAAERPAGEPPVVETTGSATAGLAGERRG